MSHRSLVRLLPWAVSAALGLAACQGETPADKSAEKPAGSEQSAKSEAAAPAAATAPAAAAKPRQEPLTGGPYPTLLVSQAQFGEKTLPDGSTIPVPTATV